MTEPTAATHVFVGMFRPVWESFVAEWKAKHPNAHAVTQFGTPWLKNNWSNGDFDEPVYVTIEEALRRMGRTALWSAATDAVLSAHEEWLKTQPSEGPGEDAP